MNKEERRQKALDQIREHIARDGLHIYVVTGGGYPHFGYTIGLTESLGAELILAETYFYRLDDVAKVIRSIKGQLSQPVVWDSVRVKAESHGSFSFRKVESTWATALVFGAFDYYRSEKIECYQIVPDKDHWTIDVPDLSRPWNSPYAPGWRWLKEEWAYPVPKESVALTDLNALRGARITEVMRWEEDEWEIFSGAGPEIQESERRVVPLGVLLEADKSLLPAVDLRVGTGLWRNDNTEWIPWSSNEQTGENGAMDE